VRRAYTLLWWLALPWLPLRLWWRGRREPGYRDAIGERFGRYRHAERPRGDMLWIHAVSLGETRAAVPLVQRILRERPDASILLTHMTASGRSAGRSLFVDRVVQAWLPYDLPFAVERFLAHFTPRAGLLMETELWPNLVRVAAKRNVPLFLVNGRLSERSARGYLRVAGIAGPMLRSLAGVAAQTVDDAKRLAAIGAQDLVVTGNLKFDVDVPPPMLERGRVLRDRFGRDRRVLVLASTRDGEESLLLDAMQRAALAPQTLVVIVPRHPQRFDDVASLLARRNVAFVRRSEDRDVADDVRVVLGDSMGEMFAYYAAADVVFVGGSLLPLGGQNLIEPIAVGVPTLIGPHMFNFAQAAEAAVAAGAAARVRDAGEVFAIAQRLLDDAAARRAMGERAARFIAEHRGATERLWQWLAPRIGDGAAGPSNIDRSRIEVSP
jgi:3-deoxy-D-manno-octulosonic-acid transferase